MSTTEYRRRWVQENGSKVRLYNRRWYRKNAAKVREKARRIDTPERRRERNERFLMNNPNYFRDWFQRRKFARYWSKWTTTCAANRRAMESRT